MMHKAEKKYKVGNVTDEEQAKQRQLKAILNKLTPQNFEKLSEQVKAVKIDNAMTLTGVVSQIFDKALMEPTFCEMYANLCCHLAVELPDFNNEENEKITFKRLLLNKCQAEFERGEREQEEANKADEEGDIKQSAEEREEKKVQARRRMLGNIRLIGELYKKRMLAERIMHACIHKLLGQYQNPDEEDVEALCKLMSTIGEMIDHPKVKERMDAYFDGMKLLSTNMNLSSRVRFMLKDALDLRKNKWKQRRKVEGFRGVSTPVHGFGNQAIRLEERQPYEARMLSVSLPQRPTMGDDSITLGPQVGLGRGMSIRGSPSISSAPVADVSPGPADSRRMAADLNGYSTVLERTTYGTREDLNPRYNSDRIAASPAYDHLSSQERNVNYGNRELRNPDRSLDRSLATSPPARGQGTTSPQNVPSEKVWPEERLREMSMAAIKEFYSNMESSGGETISSIQSMRAEDEVISGRRPLCYCGIPSKLRMSDNPESFNRQFLNCPYYNVKKQCGFFEWIDREIEQSDCCKRTLELAQRRNKRIAVECARIEHAKFHSMKKKYKSALIASWVLFIALLVSKLF